MELTTKTYKEARDEDSFEKSQNRPILPEKPTLGDIYRCGNRHARRMVQAIIKKKKRLSNS